MYKGIKNDTKELVALKKMVVNTEDGGIHSMILREISTLRDINHPNIIKLIDVVTLETKIYLVLEYFEETLHQKI